MGFSIDEFHHRHRDVIIQEWVNKLEEMYHYSRPRKELFQTCTDAFEANYWVIVRDDYEHIDRFIQHITRMRLEAGFLLSDVQKAFELYRIIVIPLLAQETTPQEFCANVTKINHCLAYTIHRFSDHFQGMHQRQILEHNRRLEQEVRTRTSELQESELKYRTLVEEIFDGYFVVQDKSIVFANKAFCEMHGYSLNEVIGQKYFHFVAPEDRSKIIEIINKIFIIQKPPRTIEYMRVTKKGNSYPTEILARDACYGQKNSVIGICRDITQRVEMEKKVREAERMAYIGQITTSLSHELRNPLSSVKMNLQILNKSEIIKKNDQRRIDISIREVGHLENILSQLLDFAKPVRVKLERLDMQSVITSGLELLEHKFQEKKINVSSQVGNVQIIGDREKLEQVFINLFLNAIEASPEGDCIRIQSTIDNHPDQSTIHLHIRDNGPGVPKDFLREVFKPFFTTKSKGTGLGLSIVQRILEAHGGSIQALNLNPRGAAFVVTLPLRRTHDENPNH
ncbi:MAG: two-component system sensor histidine kinase NtrB [Thermodesulfobacteriota bacterium]